MKRRKISSVIAVAAMSLMCVSAVQAAAYTPDDVAAKAREAGWPEYLIQAGYNQWASGDYTQDKLDAAYNSVMSYSEDTEEMICNVLGIEPKKDTPSAAPTEPQGTTEAGSKPSAMKVTKADGTVEDRISPADFINMSLDQKKAYVDSLSEDSKRAFIDSLSKEERNSMIKQLPADDKAALMQTYIDAADSMGLNVTVDSINGNNISMTIRDENGTVVDKAAVGVTIDETGISHTKPLAAAAGGALIAVLGFGGLYCYIRKTET